MGFALVFLPSTSTPLENNPKSKPISVCKPTAIRHPPTTKKIGSFSRFNIAHGLPRAGTPNWSCLAGIKSDSSPPRRQLSAWVQSTVFFGKTLKPKKYAWNAEGLRQILIKWCCFFDRIFPPNLTPEKCRRRVRLRWLRTRVKRDFSDVCWMYVLSATANSSEGNWEKKVLKFELKWGGDGRFDSRSRQAAHNRLCPIFESYFAPCFARHRLLRVHFFQATHVVWTFDWLVMGCWTVNMCKLNEIENENFKMWVKI